MVTVSNRTQRVVADILTKFMFTKTMDEVIKVWEEIYNEYGLCDDPFTHTPCSQVDWCKLRLEYDRQTMMERYGHFDGLE